MNKNASTRTWTTNRTRTYVLVPVFPYPSNRGAPAPREEVGDTPHRAPPPLPLKPLPAMNKIIYQDVFVRHY